MTRRPSPFQIAPWLGLLTAAALWTPSIAQAESTEPHSQASRACTDGESWNYGSAIGSEWRERMSGIISHRVSPQMGFAEALTLRKVALSDEARLLGEYSISRALYEAKLTHVAYAGFTAIASKPITSETVGIQLAALDCLNQIGSRFPTFSMSEAVNARISEYLARKQQSEIVYDYAIRMLQRGLADGASKKELQETASLVQGSGAYEAFAKALLAAKQENHNETIAELDKLFKFPSVSNSLKRKSDQAHLLLARAYYTQQKYDAAQAEFKLVKKSSNELAEALSELAWGYLMDARYSEAIGTAMNLQSGGLRHTFAPEAPMVMAMALNEICQYPESVRAVATFKKNYEKPFRWLETWYEKGPGERLQLYPQAVAFLKKQSDIPDRVASEWLRSPLFISHQDEINLLFQEKQAGTTTGQNAVKEQRKLALDILRQSRELKEKIIKARSRLKEGDPLPGSVQKELFALRTDINRYRRLRAAAPVYRVLVANQQRVAPSIETRLVNQINHELSARSERMYHQLAEIAENNQLIEVEIYNGASQDIIWQNAHPDYKQIAQQIKEEQKRSADKVWDWGRAPAGAEEMQEVWEDELGSFKADLYDNCSSKDKYLALKRR